MSDYLPPEVLFNIFLKLPSNTLRRFLSVSKSWFALITSQPFVFSHLMQNPHQETNSFFIHNFLDTHTDFDNMDNMDNNERFLFYPDPPLYETCCCCGANIEDANAALKLLGTNVQLSDTLEDPTDTLSLLGTNEQVSVTIGDQTAMSPLLGTHEQLSDTIGDQTTMTPLLGTNEEVSVTIGDQTTMTPLLGTNEQLSDTFEDHIDPSLGVPCDIMYPPFSNKILIYQVVGISNGLICLVQSLDFKSNPDPLLWNPAIDMFIQLPSAEISRIGSDRHTLGFWFDSENSDFMVMRIVYRSNKEDTESHDLPPLGEVFSLNTGEWRRINVDGVQCYMPYGSWYQYAYVNGRSHWVGCRYAPDHCLIMSFDMNDEVVREIMLPSELASMVASRVMIRENMGCLVVIGDDLYGDGFDGGFCRVWVMKEYGVFDSWTNLFELPITISRPFYKFLGFWKNGDVLMMKNGHKMVLYSPESKSVIDLDVGLRFSTYAGKYEESLALLDLKYPSGWMDEIETT